MHDHKLVYRKTKCILESVKAWLIREELPNCHERDVLKQDIEYVLRDIDMEKEDEKD